VSHTGEYNLVAVGVDDVNNAEEVADDIKDELGKDKWSVADLKTDIVEQINDTVDMMMTILLMFGVIALILSIILILNIFNIIKEEQEYETGMLQAVGASKSETFKLFLTQGVIMGVVGAIIGTICSFFMSYFIFYMTVESLKNLPGEFGEMFAQTEFEIILYPQTLAIILGVGVLSCILAAIYPSWKASRKPLIECLNPLAHKTEREKKHHKRKILYITLSILLIVYGSWLLYTAVGFGPGRHVNGNEGLSESTAAIIAPTLILFGVIGLSAIFVGPITKGFIKIFGPYLKQTKLLTRKNVLRHRKRTVLTYTMIAITVSYLVSISVIMGSIREGVQTTVKNVMGCNIRVFAQNTPRSFEDELEDIDGVADVMGVTHRNALIFDEDSNKWIGHRQLEKDWDKSVTVHILDPDKVERHMTETEVLEPSDMTLKEMMDEIEDENTMIITENEADYFDLDVDDEILVRFSLGIIFPSFYAMQAYDIDTAKEISYDEELKVIAIVEKFQGFATGEIIGQEEGAYNIYISWNTYEQIARHNLPGGNTDIIFRQRPESGSDMVDLYLPNWFNFSDVYPILDGINEIDYYTTRMDFISPTYDPTLGFSYHISKILEDLGNINLNSSVVGIRTNSSGILKDDSYFGEHILINQSRAYPGKTMEQLLNNLDDVCVVDKTFRENMRKNNPSFGINSTISIFPQQFFTNPDIVLTGGNNPLGYPPAYTDVSIKDGTIDQGDKSEFQISNNQNMTFISNKNSLEFNISINLGYYVNISKHFINPYKVIIESRTNSTIDKLEIEAFNYLTNKFDNLGDINNLTETNHTFSYNPYYPPFSYMDQSTFDLKLRIVGYNSTFSNNFSLDIDTLKLQVLSSMYEIDPTTWPNYTVIGIIEDPLLYRTERLNWMAGYEVGADIAETQNAVYINYEKARNQVYIDYNGSRSNGTYDKITHVFIHCKSVDDIAKTTSLLRNNLGALGSNWTVLDLKTGSPSIPIDSLAFRLNVFDWYIWVEEGRNDEDILDEITEYMEDNGYIVLFAFTSSYITQIFESMVDLISLIMNGILVFAIIIAMIGLALHCLLTTMARRREIGMLRSIGLNKKGVVRTISGETLVVAFLGTIVGIIAGLFTGFLMVS
ncbi:MAG: ABC transporter permease, partial [Candidatus Hodarchaeota archaeon]